MTGAGGERGPANLDELVTEVATSLMGAGATSLRSASETVLQLLVSYFGVDLSFLRFHDPASRTTTLIAEWPPRADVPDPDPLGVIAFADADPAFAATEHLADIMLVRPDPSSSQYQERVQNGSGVAASSVATVPLRAEQATTGLLGFVKYGDRGWDDDEVRALRTIALLFTQMQGRLAAETELFHIAHHDELTGLANRRALLAALEQTLAGGDSGDRALLFVDVDRLKAMNDFLGHDAGDRFIVAVAERLRSVVRAGDVVARLGGDEFVVATMARTTKPQTAALARRVHRAMSRPVRLGAQSLNRTVSVGVATARPSSGITVAEWLRNADQAVLAAKNRGGNTIVSFSEQMAATERVRVAVEMNLHTAIRDGTLSVHYQPVVDLRTRRAIGAEALLRWNHPTLGPVSPNLFVVVAEATNLAGELGEWVLDESCRQLAEWRRQLPAHLIDDFTIAVNVSPVQLISLDFVDTVADALARHGLTGSDLTLEVTEHAVVSDHATARATLLGLRQLGASVAIDDFGTGYSSLAQLKALPVTILKVDRGFVRDLGASTDDDAIVRSIIGLAEAFDLNIVAEGVETEAAVDTLLTLGCTAAQGFLFSRAVAPEAFIEWLTAPTPPTATASTNTDRTTTAEPPPPVDLQLHPAPSPVATPRSRP